MLSLATVLCTLLYTIDSTIVNVALPHMQGSLQATQDQIAWVITSYIVVSAIATPLAGWLGSRFGLRRVLTISVIGFTLGSVACGFATDLGEMVAFRVVQGLFGAALVPLAQVALMHEYPPEQHGRVMALWTMGVLVGPIVGPTLGGYLTDTLSWRWAFFINVPIGCWRISACSKDWPPSTMTQPAVRLDRLRAAVAVAGAVPADDGPRPDTRLVRVHGDRRRRILRGRAVLHVLRAFGDDQACVRRPEPVQGSQLPGRGRADVHHRAVDPQPGGAAAVIPAIPAGLHPDTGGHAAGGRVLRRSWR